MSPHPARRSRLAPALALCAGPVLASSAPAQGRSDYFNVESPQVQPITVARIGGHDWLLACNTPDNSVEVWDTDESIPPASRFRLRVRVGLEPVSVEYNAAAGRVYTADFLGDSVSVFTLRVASGTVTAQPVMTRHVGDEPVDIAFSASGRRLFVTHNTNGTFGWRDALTLDPAPPVGGLADMEQIDLVDSDSAPTRALKEPRTVLVRGSQLFVLGFKGGSTGEAYDFDLYSRDLATQGLAQLGTLGSTNFNMAFASNGDLWVVGGEAQNLTTTTEREVSLQPTGFVKSTLYRVQGAGTPSATRTARDLNDVDGSGTPVAPGLALAQPTDVVAYDPPGGVHKVYFTAFGSDRIGVLTPTSAADPYAWPLARIDVPVHVPSLPAQPNPVAGPRGLALKYANPSDPADPGDRLYVVNRLDNSLSIVDPASDQLLATIALRHDPTPAYIRTGRQFLYSAKLSGSGFVSCASCHMDARTDSLVWQLGTPNLANPLPYPPGMQDGLIVGPPLEFARDKGPMVTQSLQGLLNFEVEPSVQGFFTNAPYHWRGDQADFTGFNAAFVNLMRHPDPDGDGKGLTSGEMEAYRTFVDSIHYPPNPRQPLTRVYSGAAITDPFDPDSGSDAQRGLLKFHTKPLDLICAGRSCVQCHFLPEGSNNRGTVPGLDPIESAAMRGLFQREMRLDKQAGEPSSVVTGNTGLTHLGASVSLNGFMNRFLPDFGGNAASLLDVKKFAREFDWGVAPLVGRVYTVRSTRATSLETMTTLDLFEAQAQAANVGVAVIARLAGQDRGYWFDVTRNPPAYRLEGGTTTLSRSGLLALVSGSRDRLVFIATPLGSERRVASVSGTSTVLAGSTPFALELRPAPTNTANAPIPSLRNNWDPAPTGNPLPTPFVWGKPAVPTPPSLKSVRLLQHGLVTDGQGLYGLTQLRHEAPRRLAVAGFGILPGAVLRLYVPLSQTPPDPAGPPDQIPTIEFRLPIHPTREVLADGRRVWHTAAELEPLVLYELMLGGPIAQGVRDVVNPETVGAIPEPPPLGRFDPHASNWHYVRVLNPDGVSEGDGGWQRLLVQ